MVAPRGSVWPPTLLGRPTGRAVSVLTPLATIGPEQKTRWAPWGRFAAGGSFTLILRTVSGDALLPPHPHPHYILPAPAPESDQSFLLEPWLLLLENRIGNRDLGTGGSLLLGCTCFRPSPELAERGNARLYTSLCASVYAHRRKHVCMRPLEFIPHET